MEPEFEWDDAKRAANLDKHDIDFEDAIDVFDGHPANTIPSMGRGGGAIRHDSDCPGPLHDRHLDTEKRPHSDHFGKKDA